MRAGIHISVYLRALFNYVNDHHHGFLALPGPAEALQASPQLKYCRQGLPCPALCPALALHPEAPVRQPYAQARCEELALHPRANTKAKNDLPLANTSLEYLLALRQRRRRMRVKCGFEDVATL